MTKKKNAFQTAVSPKNVRLFQAALQEASESAKQLGLNTTTIADEMLNFAASLQVYNGSAGKQWLNRMIETLRTHSTLQEVLVGIARDRSLGKKDDDKVH